MFSFLVLKSLILAGLGIWLGIAATNNFTDPKTNCHLLSEMLTMQGLKTESLPLAKKLLWRACSNKKLVMPLLISISIIQLTTAVFLIIAALMLLYEGIVSPSTISFGINLANYALSLFCSIWLFFLCGGLWFAYWIKFHYAQQTHFTLLALGVLSAILINLPLR